MAESVDCFKEEFKRYKKRTTTDLSDVIDLRASEQFNGEVVSLAAVGKYCDADITARAARLGLKPPQHWSLHGLASVPGLVVIPNPFKEGCQHRWVRQCLVTYPCRPNVCNLDAHIGRQGKGEIWPGELAVGLSSSLKRLSKDDLLYRLRWVTLGYHYDWNTKEYYSQCRSPFPEDLEELSRFVAEMAGLPGPQSFVPEAAIVNYYHLDSTLSGHTDHSEKDLSKPLLSISFGQSAIFLIGGQTRQVQPKALLLSSGDIVIMSGDSRLAYHGVPRVLPPATGTEVPDCLSVDGLRQQMQSEGGCVCQKRMEISRDTDEKAAGTKTRDEVPEGDQHCSACPSCQELVHSWPMFVTYLSVSRINVNVRQVVSEKRTF